MTHDLDEAKKLRPGTAEYYAECARLLRIEKGDQALVFAIGVVHAAVDIVDEDAYEAWWKIIDVLCQEEGREPFGRTNWIFTGPSPKRRRQRDTLKH